MQHSTPPLRTAPEIPQIAAPSDNIKKELKWNNIRTHWFRNATAPTATN